MNSGNFRSLFDLGKPPNATLCTLTASSPSWSPTTYIIGTSPDDRIMQIVSLLLKHADEGRGKHHSPVGVESWRQDVYISRTTPIIKEARFRWGSMLFARLS